MQVNNGIEITQEFIDCFDILENTDKSLFLLGGAGTGKSTFYRWWKSQSKLNILTLAPTGVAALNIGGKTIHSMFCFPFKPMFPEEIPFPYPKRVELLRKCDIIVIDEISMVNANIIDCINLSLQSVCNNVKPFGGKRLLFLGDPFQLSPVIDSNNEEFFRNHYSSPYFFSSSVFKFLEKNKLLIKRQFTKIFRQNDVEYIKHLNDIRYMKCSQQTLDYFNKRNIECNSEITSLTSYIKTADNINKSKLNELKTPLKTYDTFYSGKFDPNKNNSIPSQISLKEGAKVMMTINDPLERFKNGTFGKVVKLEPNTITIETDDDYFKLERYHFKMIDYNFNRNTGKIDEVEIGSADQFPLQLAWAISIHKSQSQTFDKINIDIGRGAFASGQLYTALSRCISYSNLYLSKKISFSDIINNDEIYKWVESNFNINK